MYSNEDLEEKKRMEVEMNVLKEEKERMKKEIDDLKTEKNRKEVTNKEQNKKIDKRLVIESKRRVREELFPPLPAPGPSGSIRTTAKAGGPAEECEELEKDSFRVGEWDYVGRGDAAGHRERERNEHKT